MSYSGFHVMGVLIDWNMVWQISVGCGFVDPFIFIGEYEEKFFGFAK